MSSRFVPRWWTWRASAHARLASLGTLWALIMAAPALGPLAAPVVGFRLAFSTGQMVFNTGLARVHPLEGRTRADWLLFALTFLLACVASEVGKVTGDPRSPLLLGAVAIPYSIIQIRSCTRSYRADTLPPQGLIVPLPAARREAA